MCLALMFCRDWPLIGWQHCSVGRLGGRDVRPEEPGSVPVFRSSVKYDEEKAVVVDHGLKRLSHRAESTFSRRNLIRNLQS